MKKDSKLLDLEEDIRYFENVLKACANAPPERTARTRERLQLLYEAKAKYAESIQLRST
jgi:hypothetical protein